MKTKHSLFTSIVALVLCVAMLAGTTFAWFTDAVTSKDNIIQSGNLQISLKWANDFNATEWQDATTGAIFTHDNWEPGYTDVKYIKITNAGNLNLKWRLTLEAEGRVTELSDVIGVYSVNPANGNLTSLEGLTPAGTLTNVLNNKNTFAPTGALARGEEVIVAIAMHMDEEAGNQYQGMSLCDAGFTVKLVATQNVGESDSFDDQYDNDAEWPEFKMDFEATQPISESSRLYGALVTDVTIRHESGAYAIVPAGVKIADDATELKFTGKNVESNGNFADAARSYDIHIEGIAGDNNQCITVFLGKILEPGLAETGLKLYHESALMTRVNSESDFAAPDQYTYNAETGAVTIYVENFSVFSAVQTTASTWDENTVADTSWYNENDTEFVLNDVADFLGFRDLVDASNTFAGKTVTLGADIDLNNKLFNPIGGGWAYNGGNTFNGTFDGDNHTIYNIYVNGWELDATDDTHSGTSMGAGLFSSIHNATIKNLAICGADMRVETTSIGVVVGCAQGQCTFENIIVSDAVLGNYQMRNGGIVGDIYVIDSDGVTGEYTHTFKNIVVDSTVKLCSMWGDFDTGNGGVIGGKYGSAKVLMQNVVVAAELDVFSDVTAAYQWYAYRRCGMLVGYTGQNSPKQATNAAADFLTCENVTVYYGDWTNYTYYQFADQTDAEGNRLWNSNYPWVRAQESVYNGPFSNVRYGNPVINGVKVTELSEEAFNAAVTDSVTITFNQLYGGGQGVYGCANHKQGGVTTHELGASKTVYIFDNEGLENLGLKYWFANGNDTWTTVVESIPLENYKVPNYNVFVLNLPAFVESFTITVGDEEKTTFKFADLEDGGIYTVGGEAHEHNYTDGECDCGAYETQLWKLVTDISELNAGDKIVVVAKNANLALSITQNTSNRAPIAIKKNANDTLIINENVQIIKLEEGQSSNTFAFNVGDGYLYHDSADNNNLKTTNTLSNDSSWAITIENDGLAAIVSNGESSKLLKYNPSSSLFSCYTSGQQDVVIYKLVSENSEVPPHNCLEYAIGAECEVNATCEKCAKEIPNSALGHDFVEDTCSRCGANKNGTWVRTDLADIKATDTVVIVLTTNSGTSYAISNNNGASNAPTAVVVTVSGNQLTGAVEGTIMWNISNDNGNLTIYPNGTTETWLYCTSTNNGVRVGTNANKVFTIDATSGYLKNTATSRYVGVYTTNPDIRCYTNTTGNIANQTLAFYVYNEGTSGGSEGGDTPACEHTNTTTTTVDATCTEAGSTTVTCDDCGETVSTETLPVIDHTDVNTDDNHNCDVCGAENVTEHKYVDGKCNCGAEENAGDTPTLTEKTYSYTFTSSQFTANGTKTLEGVSWTLAGNGGYWGYDGTKGQQFGSGNAPYKSMTLTSAEFSNVSKIVINTSGASSISGSFIVTVGGVQVGSETTLTKTATEYAFEVGDLTGPIVITYTQTSSKAIYIKSISITYAE